MTSVAAGTAGVLLAVGLYLLMSRDTQRIAMGFLLLSNGMNLLVLTAGGMTPGARPPIVDAAAAEASTLVDPLPQAFLLTAIVIGLGAAAFLLALAVRMRLETGADHASTTRAKE